MRRDHPVGPAATVLLLLAVVCAAGPGATRPKISAPSSDRLPDLARDLSGRLLERSVRLPDGTQARLFGEASASPAPLLTTERLVRCFEAISEAKAWSGAWLVVQDRSREFDLVLRIELRKDGQVEDPDPVFTAARREWDADAVEAAARAATGRKSPREPDVVVQSFTKRTETVYVYEPADAANNARGLLALLPKGALIREARRIDLGDDRVHTLALVLLDPRFVPSACGSCETRAAGHVDTGTVLVVLAGEKALEAQLDLTGEFARRNATPFLQRYACAPGDEDPESSHKGVNERFRDRKAVPLLDLVEAAGDGKTLQFVLPYRLECERRFSMTVAVVADAPRIRVLR